MLLPLFTEPAELAGGGCTGDGREYEKYDKGNSLVRDPGNQTRRTTSTATRATWRTGASRATSDRINVTSVGKCPSGLIAERLPDFLFDETEETDMNYDEGMSKINNVRAAKVESNMGTDDDEKQAKKKTP